MKALKPFPDAANKTSIAVFRKTSSPPRYPVPYRVWSAKEGNTKAVPTTLPLATVMTDRIEMNEHEANPVGGPGSPWSILPPGRFPSVSSISGRSTWVQGRKGITTDLNAIYFVTIEEYSEGQTACARTHPAGSRQGKGRPSPLVLGRTGFAVSTNQGRGRLFPLSRRTPARALRFRSE